MDNINSCSTAECIYLVSNSMIISCVNESLQKYEVLLVLLWTAAGQRGRGSLICFSPIRNSEGNIVEKTNIFIIRIDSRVKRCARSVLTQNDNWQDVFCFVSCYDVLVDFWLSSPSSWYCFFFVSFCAFLCDDFCVTGYFTPALGPRERTTIFFC